MVCVLKTSSASLSTSRLEIVDPFGFGDGGEDQGGLDVLRRILAHAISDVCPRSDRRFKVRLERGAVALEHVPHVIDHAIEFFLDQDRRNINERAVDHFVDRLLHELLVGLLLPLQFEV